MCCARAPRAWTLTDRARAAHRARVQGFSGLLNSGSSPGGSTSINTSSLPDVLRARAEGMDIDEIELGPLIGRGCAQGVPVFLVSGLSPGGVSPPSHRRDARERMHPCRACSCSRTGQDERAIALPLTRARPVDTNEGSYEAQRCGCPGDMRPVVTHGRCRRIFW